MTDADAAGSPLAAAAGAAGANATEAFELLSSKTRLAILLALWEAYDPHAAENAVPFSDLRERVGTRDSGQFNYHLGKLEGRYVDKTDAGYSLRPVGLKLVQTVIAGAGAKVTLEPTEIDMQCDFCGAPTAVAYQDGWLYQLCTGCPGAFGQQEGYPEGILLAEPFPPAAVRDRAPEELFAAGVFMLVQVFGMKMGELCPTCSGVIEASLKVCEEHVAGSGEVCAACGNISGIRIKWTCSVCKYRGSSSPGGAMLTHPAVVAFYHDRGVDIGFGLNDFERAKQVLTLIRNHDQELLSTDPLRVVVTVPYEGDELRLTLDEELTVIESTVID